VPPPLDRLREYRCPSCHALLGSSSKKKLSIGTPFLECACGTFAARPPFSEWDMLDPPTKLSFLGRGLVWFLSGMIPGLLYALTAVVRGRGYSVSAFLIAVAAGALLAGGGWAVRAALHIRRSRRRMGDPMYRAKLVEYGTQATRS